MKIALLNAGVSGCDSGLGEIRSIIAQTLSELGVEVIDVPIARLGYYEGMKTEEADRVCKVLEGALAVVVLATVGRLSLGAPFSVFTEYLQHPEYGKCLRGKNCMVALNYKEGGARVALSMYSGILNAAGANDAIRLAVGQEVPDEEAKAYVERQTEDFYRIVRANKKFFLPDEGADLVAPMRVTATTPALDGRDTERHSLGSLDLEGFREAQERDISEITQYFANKLAGISQPVAGQISAGDIFGKDLELMEHAPPVPPRMRNCRQLTQSMTHHFQPHMAQGLEEVIQLIISGEEAFEGYISIAGGQCSFYDGAAVSADITIMSDSDTWTQVIKGRITAQKAFMVGQLKVRGKFVTLSKMEQYFNTKALS